MTPKRSRPDTPTYDYIVVGAGSAGCIMAERLSASGVHRILLVEAGGENKSFWTRMPMGFGMLFHNEKFNWRYYTEPQPKLSNKRIYVPRGKGIGGSGAINALVYVRGQCWDFDDWKAAGNPGWGYEDVLPYFKRIENHWSGGSRWHGGEGRIHITRDDVHPISESFILACEELGHPKNPDFNGQHIEGAGIYDINTHRGQRDSSATAYLADARRRKNLDVLTQGLVECVLFDDTRKAIGVRVTTPAGQQEIHARAEVILCAGAIDSPKILQRSGIGDASLLQRLQIPVTRHLPGVGRNLQDHLCGKFFVQANRPTANDQMHGVLKQGMQFLNYLLFRKGVMATTAKAGAFLRSSPNLPHPNIQLYFNPMSYSIQESRPSKVAIEPYSGFMLFVSPSRPTSRGQVQISSPDVQAAARIDPNYLATEHDRAEAVAGCRLVRQLLETDALKAVTSSELKPGPSVKSDADLLDYYRENSGSIYHLCGTCRMGPDDGQSVVSPELKVYGVEGLRVVDASVFPNLTSGNINAPTMMVAEKAADMIVG
ncbi:choline dehydrogenase-like flavoprotein [Cupriavidus metallidurans]|jgi:choline dehydrogenase|uniref:GMC family oxidoreductase n=1 Tax=Cupriavidus metallidurans TaxID=119219 RepID=UPI0004937B09|nr:GMC family oxidoreductase N-terminal domain-containing protein [Cupriavidus metallidurans]MDE4920631.1 GMC family oxidoreductase N-terminal domain-containing protein [Cupriavidus metallidurans]